MKKARAVDVGPQVETPEFIRVAPDQSTATELQPAFMWAGRPVYRCRHCQYERVENAAAVLQHEQGHQPPARPSEILGPDGQPLQVTGDENE